MSMYVVSVQKHVFKRHIVLQFTVENTVEEFELRNVTVQINAAAFEAGCKAAAVLPCASVAYATRPPTSKPLSCFI